MNLENIKELIKAILALSVIIAYFMIMGYFSMKLRREDFAAIPIPSDLRRVNDEEEAIFRKFYCVRKSKKYRDMVDRICRSLYVSLGVIKKVEEGGYGDSGWIDVTVETGSITYKVTNILNNDVHVGDTVLSFYEKLEDGRFTFRYPYKITKSIGIY